MFTDMNYDINVGVDTAPQFIRRAVYTIQMIFSTTFFELSSNLLVIRRFLIVTTAHACHHHTMPNTSEKLDRTLPTGTSLQMNFCSPFAYGFDSSVGP